MSVSLPRVVIDTNVVFTGLTQRGGAPGLIISAWQSGLFVPFASDALLYEYVDVLSRKLSPMRWSVIEPLLIDLIGRAETVAIYFKWRPRSPDPGDDLVIDCAMNASAIVITNNERDYRLAIAELGLAVMSPVVFANLLASVFYEGALT